MNREVKTVKAMIDIYCRLHHDSVASTCSECQQLLDFSLERLNRCPFGAGKPNCADCKIHCYRPDMRERIRTVMRFSGPRMMFRRPVLTFFYLMNKMKFSVKRGMKVF